MRPLTNSELLNVWEAGLKETVIEKSLRLLSVACNEPGMHAIAQLSIGERDAALLQIREWLFGAMLTNTALCPNCSQVIEWEHNLQDLRLQPLPAGDSPKEFTLEEDGFKLRFRLLNSYDLLKMMSGAQHITDAKKVLTGCILEVAHNQHHYTTGDLPDQVFDLLSERMEKEDPQADIRILVACPGCCFQWEVPFDIATYLWIEIDNWAVHLLQEVYVLAKAFGWSEQDILNMSPHRRQLYLQMLQA